MKKQLFIICICFMLMIITDVANALISFSSNPINIQGKVSTATPLTSPVSMQFDLYDSLTGTILIKSVTQLVSIDASGVFNAMVDFRKDALGRDIPYDEGYYVKISVNGTPLSPRQRLTAAPYALANVLKSGDKMTGSLKVNSPSEIAISAAGRNYGISAEGKDSVNSIGVYGQGRSSGVVGVSEQVGVYGISNVDGGIGVRADTTGRNSTAMSANATGLYSTGVYASGASTGVDARSDLIAIRGLGLGANSIGVHGKGFVGGSFEGISDSTSSGVYGYGNQSGVYGVGGQSGLYGYSGTDAGRGVSAVAIGANSTGVHAEGNMAGYFSGTYMGIQCKGNNGGQFIALDANGYSGNFSGGKGTKIQNALILTPSTNAPTVPEEGMIYVQKLFTGVNILKIYLNGRWRIVTLQ